MEKKEEKTALNDEQLEQVAGGHSAIFDPSCPTCPGNPPMKCIGTDHTGRISFWKCSICGYEQSDYNG